jgi:CheY-like chemotaxis protein
VAVLVVEDESIIRMDATQLLANAGYEARRAITAVASPERASIGPALGQ